MWQEKQKNHYSIEALFDDVFNGGHRYLTSTSKHYLKADIRETKDDIELKVDVPGVEKKDIELDYDKSVLTIKVKKVDASEKEEESLVFSERNTSDQIRHFEVGEINFQKANAELNLGVLTITLPKKEEEKAKRLEISSALKCF